ncbi:MAG: nucleotide exchange factor GrpE [Candidatus Babeliales bacterium]
MQNQEKNISEEVAMQAQGQQADAQEALKKCEQESAEWKDKYMRSIADLQNYKKRIEKDSAHLNRMVKTDILYDLLPIIDNLERALESEQEDATCQTLRQGVSMIAKELYKFLEKHGVSEIQAGTTFDPELHEAVMQVQAEGRQPGTIVEVLQKGYLLNGQVLRPAKVAVAY